MRYKIWMRCENLETHRFSYCTRYLDISNWEIRDLARRSDRWALYHERQLVGHFSRLSEAKQHAERFIYEEMVDIHDDILRTISELKAKGIM